jgi:hypothetical protein
MRCDGDDPMQAAKYATATSEGLTIHFLEGTSAERDARTILDQRVAALRSIAGSLGVTSVRPIDVFLSPSIAGSVRPNRLTAGGWAVARVEAAALRRSTAVTP